MKVKKIFCVLLLCIICIFVCACREEINENNTKDGIVFIEDIEDGKIFIDAAYIKDGSRKNLYYDNELFKEGMFCDASSLQPYFLIKSSDEKQNNLLYDYMKSKVYDLGFDRCNIIAETLNYIYMGIYEEKKVYILAFFKEDGTMVSLGEAYSVDDEYYESIATSNYDEDVVHFCYATNNTTYVVTIEDNRILTEKISDKSLSTVISLDVEGETYFSLYNTINTPYKFEPTIIKKQEGVYGDKDIHIEEGGVLFSVIVGGRYYMGYSSKNMIEVYTLDEVGMLTKLSEYENDVDVTYKVEESSLYLRINDGIYKVND